MIKKILFISIIFALFGCSKEQPTPRKPNQEQVSLFSNISGIQIPSSAEFIHWHDNYSNEKNKQFPEFERTPSNRFIDLVIRIKKSDFEDFVKNSPFKNSDRETRFGSNPITPIEPGILTSHNQEKSIKYIRILESSKEKNISLVAEDNNKEFIYVYLKFNN